MKKLKAILLSALLVLSLAACGNNNRNTVKDAQAGSESPAPAAQTPDSSTESTGEKDESSAEGTENTRAGGGNILIAYFSVMETDGVDTVSGASRVAVDGELLGNNQYIAQIIQRETGGDLFSIETVQDYPTTHDPLLEFAYEEKADNSRPELATHIENPDSYDVIFLGFPKMEYGFHCVLCV